MKKATPFLVFLIGFMFIATFVHSQSLQDNEFYQKMLNLKSQSQKAFDEGDYPEAKRLAEESRSYKELSDAWIANQLSAYRARSALLRVKNRLEDAARVNAKENFPEELAEGTSLYNRAYAEFYDEKDYIASLATSNRALDVLSVITYVRRDVKATLPAAYKVRLLPGNTDCLWNIAGYDFVYGDPWKWKKLYEANKTKLPEPINPHLILPDMVLTIPQLEDEVRYGTWVNGKIEP